MIVKSEFQIEKNERRKILRNLPLISVVGILKKIVDPWSTL